MYDSAAANYAKSYIRSLDPQDQQYELEHFHRYLQTYSACPMESGARVLDLGHGPLYCDLLQRFKGYQIEPVLGRSFDFEHDRFPYPASTFDGILLCEVLEHFTRDPMHCLLEINRIVKPNGFFVLTTPNCASWYSIYNALYHMHPSRYAHYSKDGSDKNAIHAREYLASEVYVLFEAAGFAVSLIDTFDYDPSTQRQPIPGYSTEYRGETIICVGRKTSEPKLRFVKECYGGIDVAFSEANRYK